MNLKGKVDFKDLQLGCGGFDGMISLRSSGDGNSRDSVFKLTGEQLKWITVIHDTNSAALLLLGDHELEAFLRGMHELYLQVYKK